AVVPGVLADEVEIGEAERERVAAGLEDVVETPARDRTGGVGPLLEKRLVVGPGRCGVQLVEVEVATAPEAVQCLDVLAGHPLAQPDPLDLAAMAQPGEPAHAPR